MKLNMDKIVADANRHRYELIQQISPWDFSVTTEDQEHKTRRPTVGEIAMMERFGKMSSDELFTLLDGLFEPVISGRVASFGPVRMATFVFGYTAYFQSRLPKNFKAISMLATAEIARMAAAEKAETQSS